MLILRNPTLRSLSDDAVIPKSKHLLHYLMPTPWNIVVNKLPAAAGTIVAGYFLSMNAGAIATEFMERGTIEELVALNVANIGLLIMLWGVFIPIMAFLREITSDQPKSLEEA